MSGKPFTPRIDQTKNITVGAASQNVQIVEPGSQLRVVNDGTATVWINWGQDNTVTTDLTTDIPIRPGETEILSVPYLPLSPNSGGLWVAAIAAGATGVVYFTPGEGD